MITELTKQNFELEITSSDKPALVDFWAPWCGPCRILSPVVDEIADEFPEFKICKVNVDEEPELAQDFGVTGIPTLVSFKDGNLYKKSVGVLSKEDILEMLK